MDADGLPIVGEGIDFTNVGAIHQKRTLAFLNHFISHTVRFLNRFSGVCEEKLEDVAYRLQRLDTTMKILEAKLSSVPGLDNVTLPANSSESAVAAPSSSTQAPAEAAPSSDAAPAATQVTVEVETLPEVETAPSITVNQDSRYKKYFTMLNMGVPVQAVQQKMISEGINPDLINTPTAAAPPAADTGNQSDTGSDNDSSSGFSDSD